MWCRTEPLQLRWQREAMYVLFKQCREKIKALKKKYEETMDKLRASGVGIESDDDLDDHEIFVGFKWFAEIHGVMGRRPVSNPPVLLDTSNLASSSAEHQLEEETSESTPEITPTISLSTPLPLSSTTTLSPIVATTLSPIVATTRASSTLIVSAVTTHPSPTVVSSATTGTVSSATPSGTSKDDQPGPSHEARSKKRKKTNWTKWKDRICPC